MAQHGENKTTDGAVEVLKTNGFDGLAEAVTVLLVFGSSVYKGLSGKPA